MPRTPCGTLRRDSGTTCFSYHLCFPGCNSKKRLGSEATETSTQHLNTGCRLGKQQLSLLKGTKKCHVYGLAFKLLSVITDIPLELPANEWHKAVEDGSGNGSRHCCPCGRLGQSSRALASTWPSPGHCSHLLSELESER